MPVNQQVSSASIEKFNIRVYGILVDNDHVLVTDEYIRGAFITKFPGGGLEIGEGTRDCLKREFMEETGMEVEIGEHIYTTDFYQPSAFRSNEQIISIYYSVQPKQPLSLATKTKLFDFLPEQIADPNGECEVFRWVSWNNLDEDTVTLPIDKIVVGILKRRRQNS